MAWHFHCTFCNKRSWTLVLGLFDWPDMRLGSHSGGLVMCPSVRVWERGLEWFHLGKPPRSSGGDGELQTLAQHPPASASRVAPPKMVGSPRSLGIIPGGQAYPPGRQCPTFISPVEVSAHPAHCDTLSGYKKCSAPVQDAARTWGFPLPAHNVTLPRHQMATDVPHPIQQESFGEGLMAGPGPLSPPTKA